MSEELTLVELLEAAERRPPNVAVLGQLLAVANEAPADFQAALEANATSVLLSIRRAIELHDALGRSLVEAMIHSGASTVLDAVTYSFPDFLDDGDLAAAAFAALEQTGRLEELRPAVHKVIRTLFDHLMKDRGDPWGNIHIDRYAKALAQRIGRLPDVLRREALKTLHTEGSQRGSDSWQATSASWLEERTLALLKERS